MKGDSEQPPRTQSGFERLVLQSSVKLKTVVTAPPAPLEGCEGSKDGACQAQAS